MPPGSLATPRMPDATTDMTGLDGPGEDDLDVVPRPDPAEAFLDGEVVAFTGVLASMTHEQAGRLVTRHGGDVSQQVTTRTTILVVGEEGWPLEADGRPSVKFRRAMELGDDGPRVLAESEWLAAVGYVRRGEDVRRDYTPAMLSQLLDMPVTVIRRWERLGLISATRRVRRLPYFDYREVSRLTRLASLLEAGVPRDEIEGSLAAMAGLMPDAGRRVDDIELLARDAKVWLRDDTGLLEPRTGQRVFDFDAGASTDRDGKPVVVGTAGEVVQAERAVSIPFPTEPAPGPPDQPSAADCFDEGCRLLERGLADQAVEQFRLAMLGGHVTPEAQLALSDALYRVGRADAAAERLRVAVETDPDFVEGWTQLGCLEAAAGRHDSAVAAFGFALELHPDLPDAVLHVGESLFALGRVAEAREKWSAYLDFGTRGPWADLARQRLAETEDRRG
ncbi:MAG: tetratricopeptide repeat protein [Planctomycetota bacterium]